MAPRGSMTSSWSTRVPAPSLLSRKKWPPPKALPCGAMHTVLSFTKPCSCLRHHAESLDGELEARAFPCRPVRELLRLLDGRVPAWERLEVDDRGEHLGRRRRDGLRGGDGRHAHASNASSRKPS